MSAGPATTTGKDRPLSPRAIRNAWLTDLIVEIHTASRGTYGAPRVHAELRLGREVIVGHRQVANLMRNAGLVGLPLKRRFKRASRAITSADLVERSFDRHEPNQLWVTDITEHRTREGKLYCCVVLDTDSRRVVGWSIDATASATLTTNALSMAIENRRPPHGLVIHSDHGTQSVHLMGLHPPCAAIGPVAIDVHRGRLLRQRRHRIVLGKDADRAVEQAALADPSGTRERHLRLPRDLPQPATPTQLHRHAHTHRIRVPSPPTRMTNPNKPCATKRGNITVSTRPGQLQTASWVGLLLQQLVRSVGHCQLGFEFTDPPPSSGQLGRLRSAHPGP
jgi:putative transposase